MRIIYSSNNIIVSFIGKVFLLSLLSIFFYSTNYAQSKNLRFDNLSYNEGLETTLVTKTIQDRNGFVWFASTGGLHRYDGYDVVTFLPQKGDTSSISGIIINDIYEDNNGFFWIGLGNGLNSYNPKTGKFSRYKNNISYQKKLHILTIHEFISNSEHYFWIGTRHTGLFKFYPSKKSFEKVTIYNEENELIDVKSIVDINQSKSGNILFATHQNGLLMYNPQNGTFTKLAKTKGEKPFGDNHITRTYESELLNKLIIGTGNSGLYSYDWKTSEINLFKNSLFINPVSNNPYAISCMKDIGNSLWVTTLAGGLYIYNPNQNNFTQYLPEKENSTSIASSMIYSIFQASSGIIFLSSHDKGVITFNPDVQKVNSLTVSPGNKWGLSNGGVTALCSDKNNDLWISTSYELNKFNFKTKTTELINTNSQGFDLSKVKITTISESKLNDNILWLGTYKNGIIEFNKVSKTIRRVGNKKPLTITSIIKIIEDKTGNIWISTTGWGLKVLNPQKDKFLDFPSSPEEKSLFETNPILAMDVVEDSSVWLGTLDGLYRCDLMENRINKISLVDITDDDEIIVTLKHSEKNQNVLWVGTEANGLFKYDFKTDTKTQYTVADGLKSNTIFGIVEIDKDNLWLSVDKGVSMLNYKSGLIQNYSSEDGFLAEGFNESAACSFRDTIVCFGGAEGVNYFNPKNLGADTSKPKVIIKELLLFNQEVEVSDSTVLPKTIEYLDELTLNYTDYIFSIKFTSPNFKKPNEIKYAYQLAGFNDDWIYTSAKNRMATFTNIPHGEYVFRVKAANSSGIWNEDYTSLKIIITPPFWKTWWAYTFYILFFGLVLFIYIRWRVRHAIKEQKRLEKLVAERTKELEELNDNKDRFFSIVAHDIKTPIIAVLKFSKILKNQYAILSEEERVESISDIHDWLGVSYRYLTNLLDWSRLQMGKFVFKPQNILLKNVVDAAVMVQESHAELKKIKLKTEIDENLVVFADYEMILVVLSNLISNAIKFSEKFDEVTIVAEKDLDRVQILVKDNGIGIDPKDLSELFNIKRKMKPSSRDREKGTGLGLILSKELIVKNNGDIKVESILGKSTTITFQLPKGKEVNG